MNHLLRVSRRLLFATRRQLLITLLPLAGLLLLLWSPTASAQITISASSGTICAGTSTTLTVASCPAAGAIRWSNTQTTPSIVVAPAQTTPYSATCTVTGALSTTATTTIQVNPAVVLAPVVTPVGCSVDGSVVLNATGGTAPLQYQFNNQPFQTTNSYSGLKAGTYPVVVRDAAGCTATTNVEIKPSATLIVSLTAVAAKCTGGSDGGIIAAASGGVGPYLYYLNNGTPQASGFFLDLKANTTYSIAVTDQQGCVTAQSVLVGAPVPFDIRLTAKPTRCPGSVDGTISVSATGGTGAYRYQLGTGAFQTGEQFTGLAANSYDITVQDAIGCQSKKTVAVEQPAPLRLTAVSIPANCFGASSGTVSVTATGGTGAVLYQLASVNTFQPSNVFTGLPPGAYTVVGIDANGCTSPTSVTVGQSQPLKLQATTVAATCCVCPTGAVSLTSTGGTGTRRQFQVVGQAAQLTGQINGLRPNTYRLRVTDEVGCTDSVAVVVTDAAALTLSAGTIRNVACAGGSDGEAAVQVTGGTRPFTYYWLTERRDTLRTRTAAQTTLSEGTYTVSVLDSNRCTTNTVFVAIKAQNPLPFKPTISQSGSTLVVDQPTGIQWYVRTGTDPGTPVAGATQTTIIPYQSGQYYAVITANGCSSPPSDAITFVLTALSDPGSGLSMRVVPNPVTDRLRVEIEQAERAAVQLRLLDASGRAVGQYQLPAFMGKKQAEWPLTGVPTGAYLLRANAGTRQSVLRVVVD